jgi:acyl-CoA dehydrogenase
MDFEFPEDTLMLRDMLRRFIEKEAKPLEMKYFNTGQLEVEERSRLRKAIEQLGLWGLTVPEEYGGGGLDLLTTCLIEQELGKSFIPIDIGEVNPLLYRSNEYQIKKYLEPALSGERQAILAAREPISNGFQPEGWVTKAEYLEDYYEITGCKLLDRVPEPDDFFIVLAQTNGHESGSQKISAFLVEKDLKGVGMSFDKKPRLILKNCQVSHENMLGEPGTPLNLSRDDTNKLYVRSGARYIGIGERLIEMASEHAKTWIMFETPLGARPAIAKLLAEMKVDIECSKWFVYYAAWLHDESKEDFSHAIASQIRLATGEMIQRMIDRVTMVFAGPGPSPEVEPHRFVKGMVTSDAFNLVLEQARAVIAEDILKHHKV